MLKLPRRGQPRTLAAALKALTESRKYAADVTAAARTMQLVDHKLRSKLADVRADSITQRRELRKEIERLQDELEAMQKRLAAGDGAALGSEAEERHARELEELRADMEREAVRQAKEIRAIKAQAASTAAVCDHMSRQNAELVRERETLRTQHEALATKAGQAESAAAALRVAAAKAEAATATYRTRTETAERTVVNRDEELQQQRRKLAAAEQAQREAHFLAESESRSLRAERERRIAAEKHVEELTLNLETLTKPTHSGPVDSTHYSSAASPFDILRAENREVRIQRDAFNAEREQLTARMLKWMAPGQYLEHAAASGYDITQDPLIRIKRDEILVDSRYYDWQEANGVRRKARKFDDSQTAVEQAYAAAFAARWSIVHKKHRRMKHELEWVVVGFLLDPQSEDYLLKLSQERIERMERQMAKG